MNVQIHKIEDRNNLKYVVIQGRYKGKWVFVRHSKRSTWEISGGHIEKGELADDAARRELYEETGAVDFKIEPICDYCACDNGQTDKVFGRLYFAEIYKLEELGDFEIAEISLSDEMPENMTYPHIQPVLFEVINKEIKL